VTGGSSLGVKFQTTEILTGDGTSQPGPDMPAALDKHCQVQMGTSVYVMGGRGSSGASSSVFMLEGLVWREVSPMLTPRYDLTCIAYGGKIYANGGYGGGSLSTVEIYDPVSNSWQQGPELPVTLYDAQVINHQDIIYVLGGWVTEGLANTQVFTLSGGEWQVVPGVTVQGGTRSVFPAPVLNSEVLFCQ
jgi:N-acetylneuraminic acid mutarotase